MLEERRAVERHADEHMPPQCCQSAEIIQKTIGEARQNQQKAGGVRIIHHNVLHTGLEA